MIQDPHKVKVVLGAILFGVPPDTQQQRYGAAADAAVREIEDGEIEELHIQIDKFIAAPPAGFSYPRGTAKA